MFHCTISSDSDDGPQKNTFCLGKVSHRSKTTFGDDDKYYTPPEATESRRNDLKKHVFNSALLTYEVGMGSPDQIWKKKNSDRKEEYTEEIIYCPPVDDNDLKYQHKTLALNSYKKKSQGSMIKMSVYERQKQKAAWNEYIHELRMKHTKKDGSQSIHFKKMQLRLSNTGKIKDVIDKQYITEPSNCCTRSQAIHLKMQSQQSNTEIIKDVLDEQNITASSNCCETLLRDLYSFQNQYFTYPCSSFGRMLMTQGEPRNSFALGPSCVYSRSKNSKDFENHRKIISKTDINPTRRKKYNTTFKLLKNANPDSIYNYSINNRNSDTKKKQKQILSIDADDSSDLRKMIKSYVKRGKETYQKGYKKRKSKEQKRPFFPNYSDDSIDVSRDSNFNAKIDTHVSRKNRENKASKSNHQIPSLFHICTDDPIDTSRYNEFNARREKNVNLRENIVHKNKIQKRKLSPSYADDSFVEKGMNLRRYTVHKSIEQEQESFHDNNSNDSLRENTLYKIKEEFEGLKSAINESPLKLIEDKLNTLIAQINLLISQNVLTNIHKCPCKRKYTDQNKSNKTIREGTCCKNVLLKNKKDEECNTCRNKDIVNKLIHETMAQESEKCCASVQIPKMNEILFKEMKKSNQTELNNKDMNGEVSSDILIIYDDDSTRHDRGTVVTSSFLKANLKEDLSHESRELYAIYPNNIIQQVASYDPLGIFSLFKISSATIGRMFSFMQYGYQSLLPQILPRQTTARPPVVAFNCNICESSFQKSVEFSEHIIRVHKAEPSKDCCVCRHKKIEKAFSRIDPPSLFRCQYCDQTFTRSYCCELHELHCPMRRGRAHELPENLVILS